MPKSEKSEHWRKYKGTSPEHLCAAIRELWLAKYPNYIRLLNEVPNKLIEREANDPGPNPKDDWYELAEGGRKLDMAEKLRIAGDRNRLFGRQLLKELEKFLDTPPFGDHFYETEAAALEDELYWKDPDAPLSEYVAADKKRDALVKKFSIKKSPGKK